tara:strand:+ start:5012 stop:5305 length:294 start_codon:yes stop_codon:yes gene_type:complete
MHSHLHIDLIGRVSTDHVQDGKPSARVTIDPGSELQHATLIDDDELALVDPADDELAREDASVQRHDELFENKMLMRNSKCVRTTMLSSLAYILLAA